MSEVTVEEMERISVCRIMHLGVRFLFAINVLVFATDFWAKASRAFTSLSIAGPLVYLAGISSFVLPIIAIVEAVIFHRGSAQYRRDAAIDIAITSLWAIGMFGWLLYGLTHYVVL